MRRILLAMSGLALACATSSSPTHLSETQRAQKDAQQGYQDAANSQKHASDEQQKAEQAQQDVYAAEKALADAHTRLNLQRSKAAQAQREAGQAGRDSQIQLRQEPGRRDHPAGRRRERRRHAGSAVARTAGGAGLRPPAG